MFNKIIINFFLLLFFLILMDYICICIQDYKPQIMLPYDKTDRVENNLYYDKNKKSIIVAGCSYTYGVDIPANQNISYKLQKLTKRKVYNKGVGGYGPHTNLKDIQTSDFFNNNDEMIEPEYYIYTFISDHMRRIYIDYWDKSSTSIYSYYKIKNNKLIPKKEKVTLCDYIKITRLSKWANRLAFDLTPDEKKFDRLKLYLFSIREELLKRYPYIKIVILVYNPEAGFNVYKIKPFRTDRWKELEDEGFIVLRLDSPSFDYLKENNYLAEDVMHPGGKAWDRIVPIITEKLELKK